MASDRYARRHTREVRISVVKEFIRRNVDREVADLEIASIQRLSDQALHLLVSAIAETTHGE